MNDEDLPKLNSVKSCPKCTHSEVPPGIEYVYGCELSPNGELINTENISTRFQGEFILRTCYYCEYKWKEACADANQKLVQMGM